MPSRGPVLALDFGTRRIGIAVSDRDGTLAFPAGCLERTAPERDIAALRTLIEEREIARVVVGLPVHMDGRVGPEAEAARSFARALADATGLRVEMLDERWTTVEAERSLREGSGRRRARRGVVDSVAATLLLRTYLAHLRAGGAGGEARAR